MGLLAWSGRVSDEVPCFVFIFCVKNAQHREERCLRLEQSKRPVQLQKLAQMFNILNSFFPGGA